MRNRSTHDVVVIGSGFAGSVTAARLAEHGARVLILERGVWRGPGGDERPAQPQRDFPRGVAGLLRDVRNVRFTRPRRSRELMLNRRGLFEIHRLGGVSALTVSGVGGGSLVHVLLVEPDAEFFDAYPDEITAADMAKYFDRVRSVVRPAPLPRLPEKNAVVERAAERAGMGPARKADLSVAFGADPARPERFRNSAGVEQETCSYLGECVLGCPRRAKTTMDLTYLPIALKHGAELRVLAEVTALERRDGEYRVGYRDHDARCDRDATARQVVLAAGALNTLRLLFVARDKHRTLPDISRALGRGFSANGDVFALAWRTAHLSRSDHGPNGGGYLARHEPSGRFRHVILEGGVPLSAFRAPRALRRRLAASTFLNTIGRDGADAELELRGDGVALRHGHGLDRSFFDDMEVDLRRLAATYGATRTFVDRSAITTAHPMGGAAIADTPQRGVVDHRRSGLRIPRPLRHRRGRLPSASRRASVADDRGAGRTPSRVHRGGTTRRVSPGAARSLREAHSARRAMVHRPRSRNAESPGRV